MSEPRPSNSDPNPEERTGDSSFLPVVIAAAIAILIILVAALVFLKIRQNKAIPTTTDHHPASRLVSPAVNPSPQTWLSIAA